jgi:hypothetical protein
MVRFLERNIGKYATGGKVTSIQGTSFRGLSIVAIILWSNIADSDFSVKLVLLRQA